jgi:hypothetical protein
LKSTFEVQFQVLRWFVLINSGPHESKIFLILLFECECRWIMNQTFDCGSQVKYLQYLPVWETNPRIALYRGKPLISRKFEIISWSFEINGNALSILQIEFIPVLNNIDSLTDFKRRIMCYSFQANWNTFTIVEDVS